jgi:hypothetical protein
MSHLQAVFACGLGVHVCTVRRLLGKSAVVTRRQKPQTCNARWQSIAIVDLPVLAITLLFQAATIKALREKDKQSQELIAQLKVCEADTSITEHQAVRDHLVMSCCTSI